MNRSIFLIAAACSLLAAQSNNDEAEVLAVSQKAFAGIAAHSSAILHSAMLPDARIYAVRDAAAPSAGQSVDDMATRLAATPGTLLERFTAQPAVTIRGRIAEVWGEYEFLRDGKFSHCGIDSFTLFKTDQGWKIATIVYTAETTGCKGH